MTTFYSESYGSITMTNEVMGFPVYCDNTEILCNSLDYDCQGARIMHDEAYTTTTYNNETYS